MPERFVVTGAAGFIGAATVSRLLASGHQVTGIDCFLDAYPRSVKQRRIRAFIDAPGFELAEADLCSADLKGLLVDCACVFHLAAQAGVRASWGPNFADYSRNNIVATERILEAATAAGVPRFVYSSSSSVYGDAPIRPTTEAAPILPVSPYGVTKLAGEHLCRLYARSSDIDCVCLRYFTVYGHHPRPDQAVGSFVDSIRKGEAITVFGDGRQRREMTFVEDVVDANILAASRSTTQQVFNIGGGSTASVGELISWLEEMIGRRANVRTEDQAAGDVRDTEADCSLAAQELGWHPSTGIREGLELTVRSMRENSEG